MRVCVGPGSAARGEGSGTAWDGVSSPPKVMPPPRNRDGGADAEGSPPPGRAAFLGFVSMRQMENQGEHTLLLS
jgi:hypothetical protein